MLAFGSSSLIFVIKMLRLIVLLLCLWVAAAVAATVVLDSAPAPPPPRRNASGCVSFSSPPSMARAGTRALVGLYSDSGVASVLLEDISDAVTRVLMASEDQEWQLCVEMVDSPDPHHQVRPVRAQDTVLPAVREGLKAVLDPPAGATVSNRAVTVTMAGDAVAVEVDSLTDSAVNISACAVSSAAGRCNLRSAVSYCESVLSEQTGLSCAVSLPAGETLDMDPALGEMSIDHSDVNGHMVINGNGGVVRSDPASLVSARLLSVAASSSLSLTVSNMTVTGFGGDSIDGGTLQLLRLQEVKLTNISFSDGRGDNGGVLYITECSGVVVVSCTFNDTSAAGDGGAIYLNRLNENILLSDCSFTDTSAASDGGALYLNEDNHYGVISNNIFVGTFAGNFGGSISLNIDNDGMTISDSSFLATSADQDGGAIYIYINTYEMTVARCAFTETSAGNDGGAIYLHDSNYRFSIIDCVFDGTVAGRDGGSLYSFENNYFCTCSGSFFADTYAANGGGVIHLSERNGGFTLSSCVVSRSASGFEGGAIYLSLENEDAVISNCMFDNITSGDDGGAIFLNQNNQQMKILNCFFTDISADDNGGALYLYQGNNGLTVSSCEFIGVAAERTGGVFFLNLDNRDITVSDCSFACTSATFWGGAIYLFQRNSNMHIDTCTFVDNSAEDGGAINLDQRNEYLTLVDSVFVNTSSAGEGGAIYMYQNNDFAVIANCSFLNTGADYLGGALYVYEDNEGTTLLDCIFTDTWAGTKGGALYLHQNTANMVISNCAFSSTHAGKDGGAIYLYQDNDDTTVTDCSFTETFAGNNGGSVYLYQNNWRVSFTNCSFSETSSGDNGGSIHLYMASIDAVIMNCSFVDSSARISGGAVHAYVNNNGLRIYTSLFHGGTAESGGSIYLGYDNSNVQLQNLLLVNNVARTRGGAVLAHSGNFDLQFLRCVFMNNVAFVSGGAIAAVDSNSRLLIEGCTIQSSWSSAGGGLYIGENTVDGLIDGTLIENNTAGFGGGVYLDQSNDLVMFNRTTIRDNTAISEGGGIFALCGQLQISTSFLLNNKALYSAAIYSQSNNVRVESCLISGNSVRGGGLAGGMCLESVRFTTIIKTRFDHNSASAAGAILMIDCDQVNIVYCDFEDNEALEEDGGALRSVSTDLIISGCHFSHNTAHVGGGAIHTTGADKFSVSNGTFVGNTASSGNGAAVWISSSLGVDIAGSTFSFNEALQGGGTLFWLASWIIEEPADFLAANNFSSTNRALYGNTVATDAIKLAPADTNLYNISNFVAPVPPLVVHILDFYDNIVGTDSSTLLLASVNAADALCYQTTGYVSGTTVDPSDKGVVNFTDLVAYCDPGYSLPVYVTTVYSDKSLQTISEFWFRDCVTGEYWGERICSPCETGSFSLTDPATVGSLAELTHQNVCIDCPEGSDDCFGATVIVSKGFWRISQAAKSTTRCPYEGSCGGGEATGDGLCTSGYEGPVCGVCSDGYSYRSSTHQCQPCSDSAGLDAVTILLLVLAFIALLVVLSLYSNAKFRAEVMTVSDFYVFVFTKLRLLDSPSGHNSNSLKREADVVRRQLRARLKFYVIVWQVVSLLPFTIDTIFPDAYTSLASVFSFFNLSIDASSLAKCSSGVTMDAIDNLVLQTLYPIATSLLLYIAQRAHVLWIRAPDNDAVSRIRSRYFNIFLVFSYLVLPFVSVVIFQTFSCQDVDPDDVESGEHSYMTVDYSVSCSSSRYQFGFIWAIVSIFIYPVGVPCLYFYLLYSSKDDIMNYQASISQPLEQVRQNDLLRSRQVLFEFYTPQFWFWEVVETVHRLLLTGVLVVIAQGTGAQIIVGVTVALFFLKLIDVYRPYADPSVQQIRVMCQWQIYFVFFLALVLRADFDSVDRTALDALLVLTITANLIVDGARFVWWRFWWKEPSPARHGDVLKQDIINPLSADDESARDTIEEGSSFGRGVAMSDLCTLKALSEAGAATRPLPGEN